MSTKTITLFTGHEGPSVFKNCRTDSEKMNRLASCFLDSVEWRAEEAGIMAGLKKEIKDLNRRLSKIEPQKGDKNDS